MSAKGGRVRALIRVTGVVQGVGYRQSTVFEAERLELSGAVRNLPDGSVEVLAEGASERLERLVAWCRRGPPGARVRAVDVQWQEALGESGPFRIARS
ncbi:MAG TPA: acylphosphatase [Anaeromyxobacteraceae bacterium]|nr:acylphosphatase [Anaeromyxobacteraceae bacterium]